MGLTQEILAVNKKFVEVLKEDRFGFRVLDPSIWDQDDSDDPVAQSDCGAVLETRDAVDKKRDKRIKKDRQRARNLTKYLQYVAASD